MYTFIWYPDIKQNMNVFNQNTEDYLSRQKYGTEIRNIAYMELTSGILYLGIRKRGNNPTGSCLFERSERYPQCSFHTKTSYRR